MRLIVQLKPPTGCRSPSSEDNRRPSQEELCSVARAYEDHVQACLIKVKAAIEKLVPNATVEPLTNLGVLVVDIAGHGEVEAVQTRIRAACEDVEAITRDFEIEAIPALPDRSPPE